MTYRGLALNFSVFLCAMAMVNDIVLLDSYSITFAKMTMILSLFFALLSGYRIKSLTYIEVLISMYVFGLIFSSLFFSTYDFGNLSVSVSFSLVMGWVIVVFFKRAVPDPNLILFYFNFWIIFSVFVGIIQALSGHLFFSNRIFESNVIPGFFRSVGFMSDPNYFSLICLIGVLSFYIYYKRVNFLIYIPILGVLLSGSRGGLIILLLTIVSLLFIKEVSFKLIVKYFFISLSLLGFFFLLSGFLPDSISMLFEAESYSGVERNSLSDRFSAILAGWEAFLSNPFWGYGLGNLVNHPLNVHNQVSHNTIVEILAESGFFGLFLYLSIIFYLLFRVVKFYKRGWFSVEEAKGLLLLIIVFNVMSLTIVSYYSRILFFLLLLFVVYFDYASKYRR